MGASGCLTIRSGRCLTSAELHAFAPYVEPGDGGGVESGLMAGSSSPCRIRQHVSLVMTVTSLSVRAGQLKLGLLLREKWG